MTERLELEQYAVGPIGTNCYFAIERQSGEALIVDPGAEAERLASALEEKQCHPVAILLTHGHFDHAGAALPLAERYEIPVFAHEAEQKTLDDPQFNLSGMIGGEGVRYFADVYVRDMQEIRLAGFSIRVLFTPGHTEGGCCYYLPYEDVVFSGDSLFCGSVGRTDFPGGSASVLVQSVRDKLLTLPDNTLVLPGHDARTTIEQERMYNPFL